jgi:predicted DNA-binding WGR domain protein
VQPDLFGCIILVKAWGRIRGRVAHELHPTEALAIAALQRQAEEKRRRGYCAFAASQLRQTGSEKTFEENII